MERKKSANLLSLKNLRDPGFAAALSNMHVYVTPENIGNYTKALLDHFRNETQLEFSTGRRILQQFCHILSNEEILDSFNEQKLALLLPYKTKRFQDDLLDVLYVLITRSPYIFDEKLASSFERMIQYRGKKCLILLTKYSQQFNALKDPWPMLDLLFHYSERFTAIDTAAAYISLLSLLCQSFPAFRKGRSKISWELMLSFIEFDDNEILIALYQSLAGIMSVDKSNKVPFKNVKEHFNNRELRPFVISFLMVSPLDPIITSDDHIVKVLLKQGRTNNKATLLLMKMSKTIETANLLASNTKWIQNPLPEYIETFRLFLVLYSHASLRPILMKSPQLITLLTELNSNKLKSMTILLCNTLRRMELTEDFILALSSAGFIKKYFQRGIDNDAVMNILLFADSISRVRYIDELKMVCTLIVGMLQKPDDKYPMVCQVGIDLSKHRVCNNKFQKIGVSILLSQQLNNELTKKQANRFLKALSNS